MFDLTENYMQHYWKSCEIKDMYFLQFSICNCFFLFFLQTGNFHLPKISLWRPRLWAGSGGHMQSSMSQNLTARPKRHSSLRRCAPPARWTHWECLCVSGCPWNQCNPTWTSLRLPHGSHYRWTKRLVLSTIWPAMPKTPLEASIRCASFCLNLNADSFNRLL